MEDFLNQDFSKPKEEEKEAKGEEEKDAEEDLDFRYYAGVPWIDQELVNRVYTPEKQEKIERIVTEKRERLENAFMKLHIEELRKKWQL